MPGGHVIHQPSPSCSTEVLHERWRKNQYQAEHAPAKPTFYISGVCTQCHNGELKLHLPCKCPRRFVQSTWGGLPVGNLISSSGLHL